MLQLNSLPPQLSPIVASRTNPAVPTAVLPLAEVEQHPHRQPRGLGSRDTNHSFFSISHDFPGIPPANQVPPRTAAAGSAASRMHRVAAQAPLACLSRRLARRSTSGSRSTAGTVHRPSELSPWSELANGFPETRDANHGFFSNYGLSPSRLGATAAPPTQGFLVHETRDTNHGLFPKHGLRRKVRHMSRNATLPRC